MATATPVIGKVVQVSGPAVDCEFPEGQIPEVHTAIRITSEGFDVPQPIDIICEAQQHIGEGRVRTIALKPTEGLVRGMRAESLGHPVMVPPGNTLPSAGSAAANTSPNIHVSYATSWLPMTTN